MSVFHSLINQLLTANQNKKGKPRLRSYEKRIANENDKTHLRIKQSDFIHVNHGTPAEMRRIGIQHRQIKRILRGRPWDSSEQMLQSVFYATKKINHDLFIKYESIFYDSDAMYSLDDLQKN